MSETVEIDRKKVTAMLHDLTVVRENESLSDSADEKTHNAIMWLDNALKPDEDGGNDA